ncbi:MAG: hypothetical protein KC729_09750 [Candidatus Eisenbacteria bacterium]|uniref:ZU5 domain-containing protein n=1 Tax=Eiseniibacteriota bacterium TaxID=2212470 RepID=A0A956LYJ5_UNCEI|nr:hypothetical protein [Candidatus Eisenbacteria bacterium]
MATRTNRDAAGVWRWTLTIASAALALAPLLGCSDLSVAPVDESGSSSPATLDVTELDPDAVLPDDNVDPSGPSKDLPTDPDAAGTGAAPAPPDTPAPADPDGRYVPDVDFGPSPARPVGSTARVVPSASGGELDFGIFHLSIPPGALATDTSYRLEVPEASSVRVNLYPHGAKFLKPVTITVDLSQATNVGDDATLYWYDEDNGEWVNVGGTFDRQTRTLVTKLSHFSTYAPGRAGWHTDPGKPELVEPK